MATTAAQTTPDAGFVALDREIQAIKAEILGVNRDLLLLEELSRYPQAQQWVVLVTIEEGALLHPGQISLQLDGEVLTRHDYTGEEAAALRDGGVHRLYAGRLTQGDHELHVAVSGTGYSDREFEQRRTWGITKLAGRKYMELQLGLGARKSDVALTVREWQP